MNTYKITTKHDNGKITTTVNAYNVQDAKERIMRAECCPECAIVKVVMTYKTVWLCIYSTEGMRERHFDNKQDADSFAATVNGSVCDFRVKVAKEKQLQTI